ncbi:hypothetical protein INR49_008451 [Caranx melampygus]|nr:hypothetical protein INR49_008451 [Caranx melampygus]
MALLSPCLRQGCSSSTEPVTSPPRELLHIFENSTCSVQGGQALEPVAGETQQVDNLQQVWWYHGDAQMEEAVAKADGALEPVQGLGRHAVLHWAVYHLGTEDDIIYSFMVSAREAATRHCSILQV